MLSFEVLLSAMNLKDYKYIDSLNIKSDCVVVNQCNTDGKLEIQDAGRNIKFISSKERGLSRSRNMAIANAQSDICMLCDNDVEYVDNYKEIVISAFEKNPEASTFLVQRKIFELYIILQGVFTGNSFQKNEHREEWCKV